MAVRSPRPRTRCWSTRPNTATSRSPCSVTNRSSAPRSARAACAWSRSRASPSCRPAAPRRSRTGWSCTRRPIASRPPSARWSSSCSSTTRSTARCATRAGSARCRTSPSAGGRDLALRRPQAPLRQAPGAVSAGGHRPRAVHPLLPLRALLPGGRRGLPAGAARAGDPLVRVHLRRASLCRPLRGQHRRAVPGGGPDLAPLPLPCPALGHRGRRVGLHAVPVAVQRHPHRPRRAHAAGAGARQPRGRRWLAVRQGPLCLPVLPCRRARHPAAGPRRRAAASGRVGAGARAGGRGAQALRSDDGARWPARARPTRRACCCRG